MGKIDTEQVALLAQPSRADSEQHAAARVRVQRRELLGKRERLMLGHETDTGGEFQILGDGGRHAKCDHLIGHREVLWRNRAAGGELLLGICGHRGMLRHPDGFKSERFRNARKFRRMSILASERRE